MLRKLVLFSLEELLVPYVEKICNSKFSLVFWYAKTRKGRETKRRAKDAAQ